MSFHRTPRTQDRSTTYNTLNGYGLPSAARKGAHLLDLNRKDGEQRRAASFEFNPGEGWYHEYVMEPATIGKKRIARYEGRLGTMLICRVYAPFQVWGGDGKLYHTSSRPGPK